MAIQSLTSVKKTPLGQPSNDIHCFRNVNGDDTANMCKGRKMRFVFTFMSFDNENYLEV